MKILQVAHGYPPESKAGVETFTLAVSEALASNHEVHVLAFDPTAPRRQRGQVSTSQRQGITIHYFPKPTTKVRKRKYAPVEAYFTSLLAKEAFDIVHFQHLDRFPPTLPGLAKAAQIPYVIHLHDFWYPCPTVKLFDFNEEVCAGPEAAKCFECVTKKKPGFRDFFELKRLRQRPSASKQILDEAALIIAVSQRTRLIYQGFGISQERSIVLPPALKLPSWQDKNGRGRIDQDGPLQVAFLGHALRAKGFHILLEAVRRARADIKLSLYGKMGPFLEDDLGRFIKECSHRFENFGSYQRSELRKILTKIDVVILPSMWNETYGLVLDEAFSAGIPVIASRMGGMQERVIENRTGFLFETGDVKALSELLDELAADYDTKIQKMDFRETLPSFKDNIATLEKHYQSIVSKDAREPIEIELEDSLADIEAFVNQRQDAIANDSISELRQQVIEDNRSEALIHSKVIIDLLLSQPCIKTIIDITGDNSDLALRLHKYGFQVTAWRAASLRLELLKARCKGRACPVQFMTNSSQLKAPYDVIYTEEIPEDSKRIDALVAPLGLLLLTQEVDRSASDAVRLLERLGFQLIRQQRSPSHHCFLFRKSSEDRDCDL
jgi:glycosyltransferase involved in cell wall biosynthesis